MMLIVLIYYIVFTVISYLFYFLPLSRLLFINTISFSKRNILAKFKPHEIGSVKRRKRKRDNKKNPTKTRTFGYIKKISFFLPIFLFLTIIWLVCLFVSLFLSSFFLLFSLFLYLSFFRLLYLSLFFLLSLHNVLSFFLSFFLSDYFLFFFS